MQEYTVDVVVVSMVVFTGIAAFIGFLARSIIGQVLNRRVDAYKSELQTKGAAEIERLKAELQRAGTVEIERLRAELRVDAHRRELVDADLHRRRAEAIADTYKLIASAQRKALDATRLVERPNEHMPRPDRFLAFANAVDELHDYVAQRRIFLPENVCVILDGLRTTLTNIVVDGQGIGGEWPKGMDAASDRIRDRMTKAWTEAERGSLPIALRALERTLRSILGDAETPSPESAARQNVPMGET